MDFNKYTSCKAIDLMLDDDFIRYVFKPTPSDIRFWEEIGRELPGMKEKIEEARLTLLSIQPEYNPMPPGQVDKLWDSIAARTGHKKKVYDIRFLKRKHVALFLCLFLLVATLLLFQHRKQYTYLTSFGQTASIILPDSSVIMLNANSSLTIDEGTYFTGFDMKLQGEAFFKIRKQAGLLGRKKCSVETNQARIIVTGTEFNVRTRGEKTQVYLEEGGVNISDLSGLAALKLIPGELAELDLNSRSFLKTRTGAEKYTSWKNGYLLFQQTPIVEVFDLLREQHGITSQIHSKELLNKTFSGRIPANNPELLLKAMEESFGLVLKRDENQSIQVRISKQKK